MAVKTMISVDQAHLARMAGNEEAAALYSLQSSVEVVSFAILVVGAGIIALLSIIVRALMIQAAPVANEKPSPVG